MSHRNLIYLFLVAFISTLLFSCNDQIVNINSKEENVEQLQKKPDIDPKRLVCNRRTKFVWIFDHYKVVDGKELGFYHSNFESMETMKNKWGFTDVYVKKSTDITKAINLGFEPEDIHVAIGVNKNNGSFTIPSSEIAISNYFVDEYCERYDFSLSNLVNFANQINPSTLHLSSWKTAQNIFQENVVDQYQFILNATSNTQMVCDQYHDEGIWCRNDQTDHWVEFKNLYGNNRVKSHWIHLLIDGEESDFNRLFSKANTLGVNKLWLFVGSKGNDYCDNGEPLSKSKFNSYIDDFLIRAKWNNWVKRYDQLVRYEYFCPGNDPCNTCDQNIIDESTGWILEDIIYTGYTEEYDPSHHDEDIH